MPIAAKTTHLVDETDELAKVAVQVIECVPEDEDKNRCGRHERERS